MSVTRPLIAALGTLIFQAGCATSGNIISGEGLPNPIPNKRGDLTPSPQWTPGWQLGEPDLIVKLSTPYSLPLEDSDVFRNFVIPNVTASDRYVRALEFRLDNRQVVHHAEFRLDESDASWRRDNEEPGSGFGGMDNPTAHFPDGHFVNWVPGKQASELPDGLAWRLPAQADLVVQLHMMPSGFEEVIDPQIGLYFADQPPGLSPQMVWLGSRWLPIAAGDPSFTTRDSYELPFDVEALSVLPHCHFICKDIKAWAILPDGSQQWLVRIEEWDFYRQEEFHLKRPLSLPRGTTVSMEFSYDNSADNSRNPNDPPQDIEFGPQSSNEMADLWIQVMPRNNRESTGLRRSSARHLQQKIIERQEQLVELEPDVNGHLELARYYRRASQLPEAVTQLQKALELAPENTTVLESLAIALTDVGRHHEALVHWRRCVQLAPNDSRAHLNLGTALGFSNQVAEGESHLQRATELDPSFAPAFFRLGRAQSYLGRFDDALGSFRAALALNPNEPMILQAAARLLATHPDFNKRRPSEALELANRALKLLPRPDAWSLSTLATAQAAAGDFELAATTAKLALSRVAPDEERSLGPIIQRQIDHYQQGRIEVARAAGEKRFVAPGERQPSARSGVRILADQK
jgi:tetratricopeptide (TPR) repeat protein